MNEKHQQCPSKTLPRTTWKDVVSLWFSRFVNLFTLLLFPVNLPSPITPFTFPKNQLCKNFKGPKGVIFIWLWLFFVINIGLCPTLKWASANDWPQVNLDIFCKNIQVYRGYRGVPLKRRLLFYRRRQCLLLWDLSLATKIVSALSHLRKVIECA